MRVFLIAFILLSARVSGQELKIIHTDKNTGIRGLSVVTNKIIWVSGSNGWVGRSTDAGKNWDWTQVKGYEKLDFRDIEGFSDKRAIMVNAGSPAVILLTEDGGTNWKEVYRNESKDIFLDGMDFWNDRKGLIYGDPINKRMQLLQTNDFGQSWEDISAKNPIDLQEGEASFAASGTAIRTLKGGYAWIATGGAKSRVFYSPDFGNSWQAFDHPVIQGKNSAGVFSLAFLSARTGYAVGGDYLIDSIRTRASFLTTDGGRTWSIPQTGTYGYRSAVEYINAKKLVAAGTSGVDISTDGGATWKNISRESFNCVRKAKKGSLVVLAGAKGKIALLSSR